MADKTGLEILTELVEQVKLLNKKVDLLDQNVKTLMNKDRAPPKPPVKPQIQPAEPPAQPAPKKGKMVIAGKEEKRPGVMTSGKLMVLVNNANTPIPDANIKIYDENDKVIKETKTNKAGVWMSLLAPGKYVAEISGKFRGKDLVTQNKNFIVPEGVKEFEVP